MCYHGWISNHDIEFKKKITEGKMHCACRYIHIWHQSISSVAQSCLTIYKPWNTARQASLSITKSWSLLKLMSIDDGDAIQPSHPLSSPSPPALNLSQHQGLFQWVSSSHQIWSFSFSISPSSEHPGLISFRMDWLALLAVQGTLKSLLQHHSSEASVLWHSGFFIVQLSHPDMITGKTIALSRWTFVGKIMSLLFNMPSRLVIAFLPRSSHLLISWLQSPSAVILEPQKIKSLTVPIVSPSICHEVMGPDAMILIFWMLHMASQKVKQGDEIPFGQVEGCSGWGIKKMSKDVTPLH